MVLVEQLTHSNNIQLVVYIIFDCFFFYKIVCLKSWDILFLIDDQITDISTFEIAQRVINASIASGKKKLSISHFLFPWYFFFLCGFRIRRQQPLNILSIFER